jgi:hypothetical protein
MHRRDLLKLAALSTVAAGSAGLRALASGLPRVPVHTVLLVAKCHLDVGFSLTQAKVMRRYFDVYYPAAIKIGAELRRAGGDRYTWTTGSWLLYEYLEQAEAAERRAMEAAIAAGDIDWHALPFSWQTEMIDRSMIAGSLGFSTSLDQRFGHRTIGAKMTDVPGHSRGIIAPLEAGGIRLLDIGVNHASTPPEVPEIFLWKDPGGHSLAMLYHRHGYGSVIEIPGSGIAVDVEVRADNSGPHTPSEIAAIYATLRAQFPGAAIKASNMSEVAAAVDKVRDSLPVVTSEIGDTWIYGCASDPVKVARYREAARLRAGWIAEGRFAAGDDTDRNLLRRLLLAAEHTWGTDTKSYLDDNHYRPTDLAAVVNEPNYHVMEFSWKEKRDDIDEGIASLPAGLKQQALGELEALRAVRPATEGMGAHDAAEPVETKHFTLLFDPATGAIVGLRNRTTGHAWASAEQPLALLTYQTLSSEQYAVYRQDYLTLKADWSLRDFGKPGIERFNAVAEEWHPSLKACRVTRQPEGTRVVLELAIEDPKAVATGNVAWPAQIFLEAWLPDQEARIDLRVVTLGKIENRMPEALWLTFAPAGPDGWSLEKVGQLIDPLDVVSGGGRAMHAVSGAVRCQGKQGATLGIDSLDAPVVALGERSPLNFTRQQPDLSKGAHFSLFNNAWGTNYLQWCGGDWAFRFTLFA